MLTTLLLQHVDDYIIQRFGLSTEEKQFYLTKEGRNHVAAYV